MGIYVTQGLNQILDGVSPKTEMAIIESIQTYIPEIKDAIQQEIEGGTMAILNQFDRLISENKQPRSCKRGCNSCCHINVDITKEEGAVIVAGCGKERIPIDTAYLLKQLAYPPLEMPITPVSACIFLKNGECSIYEYRPIACRKYFAVTPAEWCNASNYQKKEIAAINDLNVEGLHSAFLNVVGANTPARMPQVLLNILKSKQP